MATETKVRLINDNVEQCSGNILNLSGTTNIYGILNTNNGYYVCNNRMLCGNGIDSIALGTCADATPSNISIGCLSGVNNDGVQNISIGNNTGRYGSGDNKILIGFNSGYGSNGHNNVLIGASSGYESNGSELISIGLASGQCSISNNSIFIGNHSGIYSVGNDNIFIGEFAGCAYSGSSKLIINNSQSTPPIIEGDLLNNELCINGNLIVNGSITSTGSTTGNYICKDINDFTNCNLTIKGKLNVGCLGVGSGGEIARFVGNLGETDGWVYFGGYNNDATDYSWKFKYCGSTGGLTGNQLGFISNYTSSGITINHCGSLYADNNIYSNKNQLVATQAWTTENFNNYIHPNDGGTSLLNATGLTVVNGITVNTLGHVTNISTRELKIMGGINVLRNTSASEFKTITLDQVYASQYYGVIQEGAANTLEYYKLAKGDYLTFRVFIDATNSLYGGSAEARFTYTPFGNGVSIGSFVDGGSSGYSTVFVPLSTTNNYSTISFGIAAESTFSNYQLRYKEAKAEIGRYPTSWSPAPEDTSTYSDIILDIADVGNFTRDNVSETITCNWTYSNGLTSTKIIATNVTDNSTVAANITKYDGYGVLGNRGTIYLTNANTSGNIKFGINSIHGSGVVQEIYSDNVTINQQLNLKSNLKVDGQIYLANTAPRIEFSQTDSLNRMRWVLDGSTMQLQALNYSDGAYLRAPFSVDNAAISSTLTVSSDSRVGVGTGSPSEKLDVVGNIKSSGQITATNYLSSNGGSLIKNDDTLIKIGDSSINIGGVELIHNQSVKLKTTSTGVQVNNNLYLAQSDTYLYGGGHAGLYASGVEYFRAEGTSNKLSIYKPTHITGDLTMNGDITLVNACPEIKFVPAGANDYAGIRFNYTNNDGNLEFWTTDDYSEPFVWRSYDVGCSGTYQQWMCLNSSNLYVLGSIYEGGTALSSKYLGASAKASDSDKLDGLDSTQFLRSDASDITTGSIGVCGNLCVGNITTAGNRAVCVMSADGYKAGFEAYGSSQGTGYVYVGQSTTYGGGIEYNGDNSPVTTGAGADNLVLWRKENSVDYWTAKNCVSSNDWEFRANVCVGGQLIETSDIRYKENIKSLPNNTLSNVMKLRPVTYNRIDSDELEYGLIAQELETIYPDLVKGDEYKSITYTKLTSILIKSIQEQQKIIDDLKNSSIMYQILKLIRWIKNKMK